MFTVKQKLWIAKAWINFSIGLMILALVGLVTLMGWGLFSMLPPEALIVFGWIALAVGVVGLLAFLFEKAENYIEAHGGSKK